MVSMGLFDKVKSMVSELYLPSISNPTHIPTESVETRGISHRIITSFDLSKIRPMKNGVYLIGNENVPIAIRDILYLNLYLKEAPRKHPCFPLYQISANQLYFHENIVNGFSQYCFLSFSEPTKTGKQAKYPIVLHFHISDKLFGEIFYGQTGEIDKAHIIAWNKHTCCELKLSLINGKLDINSIYKTNPQTYQKQKMYYQ
jgi:hypothetical protein